MKYNINQINNHHGIRKDENLLSKDTLKLSLVLLFNYLIVNIVAMVIIFGVTPFKQGWIDLLVTIITVIWLWCVSYSKSWKCAYRDVNQVKMGHIEEFKFKGLAAGLYAIILPLIAFILFCMNSTANIVNAFYIIFLAFNGTYYYFLSMAIAHHLLGLLIFIFIPMPVLTSIGYILGYKQISLKQNIVYKKQ